MKPLSVWLIAAVILTSTSPLALKKAPVTEQSQALPAWSASLSKQNLDYNSGMFKTITAVQEYFDKLNLMPGASLSGGLQLMYKVD